MADTEKAQISKDIFTANKSSFNRRAAVERLLQFVRAEKPYFKARINPIDLMTLWFVVPKLSNPRIIAQRGAFIIYGLSRPAGEGTGVKPMTRKEWIIPHAKKEEIRTELSKLSITAAGLFPEIERAAGHVISQLG